MTKKMLLINISRIGDVVSSMVVANYMKERFGEIDFLIQEGLALLLSGEKDIKTVTAMEALQNRYDLLIDLTSSKDSRDIVLKINANKKIGFYRSLVHKVRMSLIYSVLLEKKIPNHIVKGYYPILKFFGEKRELVPKLTAGNPSNKVARLIETIKEGNKQVVGIHFGAGNPIRQLPNETVIYLVKYFQRNNINVIILGNERKTAEILLRALHYYPFYQDLKPDELKTIIANLDLFIGPDSGLLHIAAALDVHAIGLYGPNLSSTSAPLTEKVDIVELDLACRPCNQNKKCPFDRKCLVEIPLSGIYQKIKKYIEGTQDLAQIPPQ